MAIVPTGLTLTAQQKEELAAELHKRNAMRPCARCGNDKFAILDYVFANPPVTNIGLPGPGFPTIAVVCTNCGVFYHHLLGLLFPLGEFNLG